ncbi:hypothetical protein A1O7_05618 [Cladophialophora yegresii CBS 114405]|uniref:Uncharacterized protein n=1 Tax=Cladophialophora yegresii CBS 114405 TaxID=1182544 RepID=W9VRK4_9EURO|nr:uncharacterized protein A1O7_05618 [Cladophialophora yegresii CBS 114405]EXJ58193.1 hypothetical protein A1O7_05618 [Cladophialophora yegresii CBS 114405]
MVPKPQAKQTARGPSEADIATNRARVNYSEASRLAKAWLSGFTFTSANGSHDRETDTDQHDEEEAERELLKHQDRYSDTGGIGYRAPESSSSTSTSAARPAVTDPTTMFLRKQLLGGRSGARSSMEVQRYNATAGRIRSQVHRTGKQGDSDEDESRASVSKGRGARQNNVAKAVSSETAARTRETEEIPRAESLAGQRAASADHDSTDIALSTRPPSAQAKASKKRGTGSYLDELLASRAAKRQKKNKGTGSKPG